MTGVNFAPEPVVATISISGAVLNLPIASLAASVITIDLSSLVEIVILATPISVKRFTPAILISVISAASTYAEPKVSTLNSLIVPSVSTKLFGVDAPVCSDNRVSPSTNSPVTLERTNSLLSSISCSTIPTAPLV